MTHAIHDTIRNIGNGRTWAHATGAIAAREQGSGGAA